MFDFENFKNGKPNFKSVKEVKEFLMSTDDVNVLGAICFAGSDGSVEHEIPISVLIEDKGIEETAKILFEISKNAEIVSIEKSEISAIKDKIKNGVKLTKEEERKLEIIKSIENENRDFVDTARNSLFNGITMTLASYYDEHPLFSTVGGLLALSSTYLECALIVSDEKLSNAFCNSTTAEDVANLAVSKIHIDEDMSKEMAILGLLHKIGQLATESECIRTKPLNLEDIVNAFGLDYDFVFDRKLFHDEEDNINSNQNQNGSNTDNSEEIPEQNQNGSNIIRNRLKRK
jgi:hypothetical protein